jgi:hypothetical protein
MMTFPARPEKFSALLHREFAFWPSKMAEIAKFSAMM